MVGAAMVGVVVVASLAPVSLDTDVGEGDKVAHLVAYGALMFWFAMLAPSARSGLAWAAGFASLGVVLEFAQELTGYRNFDIADMVANAAGVVLGYGLAITPAGRLLAWLDRKVA